MLMTTAASSSRLGRLSEIPLGLGVNNVPRFAVDGRTARIIVGWRDNGNAHGYSLYLVLMPTKRGGSDWNVVGFEDGKDFSDTINDNPHTGEDVVTAVRFLRAGPNRQPIVAVARRNWRETFYDRAETTIVIYDLRQSEGIFGTTQDYFTAARRWKAKKRYCNAELALRDELNLPLPSGYGGPNKVDGCLK
jgi:hypothetical protein